MRKPSEIMHLRYIRLAILSLTLLPGLGWAQGSNGKLVDGIIAKVDDYIVLRSDLENAYSEAVASGQYDGLSKCNILENLVVNKVLLAKAKLDSVIVEEPQVEADLNRRFQYFINQIGSKEKIEEYYGKTIEQFKDELRDNIREQLTVRKMQQEINGSITITPAEVKDYFNRIPQDSLPFFSAEVTVGQIVKKPDVNSNSKAETRAKIASLRERILEGEDFGALAREYSEDPGSASKGGQYDFIERGSFVPEYEAAVFSMEPGEISKPVESEFGFHIIQLQERRGNFYKSRHILLKPSSTKNDVARASDFLDSLRTEILDSAITFAKAAKEYSDDKQTASSGGFFLGPDGANRIPTEELDPVIFFTIDTMQVGSITEPIEYRMDDGSPAVRILYYKDRTQPHQANMRDDYQRIYNAALQEKQNNALNEWFSKAQQQVFIEIYPKYNYCRILAQSP